MSCKIMPFPVPTFGAEEDDVLWYIQVGKTLKDEYSCKYRSTNGYWVVDIKARDLISAISLIEFCRIKVSEGSEVVTV